MLDVAVVAETVMRQTAAVTGAQVAAQPVVVELVVVRAVAEVDTARPGRRRREQLIAGRGVRRDRVVVDVHVHVEAVRQLGAGHVHIGGRLAGTRSRNDGCALRVLRGELALADVDTAAERSGVVRHAVVGDLEVMAPAVHEDGAAAL